jgi:hypothetical protein
MSVQPMEARMAHLEGAFVQVNERLGSVDRRLDSMDRNLAELRKASNQHFMWLIGIVAGSWITTAGLWITTMLTILYHSKHA